jgi:signal transduction histidine kinase
MSETLQILLAIYSIVLVVNLIISVVLSKLQRHELFKILSAMWGFSLINFFLQGIFLTPGIAMYLSFSTAILISLSLYHFSNYILKRNVSLYKMGTISAFFTLVGIIILIVTHNYSLASVFAAIAIAIPMFTSSYHLWRSKIGPASKVLSIFLFLNAIHFLDYPLLRSHPSGALWGFSIALVLLFGFSAFFPGYVLLQISSDYSIGLEKEVKNRTQELEEAVDQNKTLVNILCHDLSTPLTVLDFYFEEIMIEKPSPVHVEYGAKAVRSLQTLFNIVAKVKNLQAIGYGKKSIENEEIDISKLIIDMIDGFSNNLELKNLKLNFINLADPQIIIRGDEDLLKNQIFSNIISNAIKFSYHDSTINIIVNQNAKHVNVTIEDQGMGIPSELLPRLFKWSEKTSRIGTSGEIGTGFGLPLVKTYLEMMGASIKVESTPKEGPDSHSGSKFIVQFVRVV